jgi:hypothetical protein
MSEALRTTWLSRRTDLRLILAENDEYKEREVQYGGTIIGISTMDVLQNLGWGLMLELEHL